MGIRQWLLQLVGPSSALVDSLIATLSNADADCWKKAKAAQKLGKLGVQARRAVPALINALNISRFRQRQNGESFRLPVTYAECMRIHKEDSFSLVQMTVDHEAAALALPEIGLQTWDQVISITLIVLRLAPFYATHVRLTAKFGCGQMLDDGRIWMSVYFACILALSKAGQRAWSQPLGGDPSTAVPMVSELLNVPHSETRKVGVFLLKAAGTAAKSSSSALVSLFTDGDVVLAATAASALATVNPEEFMLHADVAQTLMHRAKDGLQENSP